MIKTYNLEELEEILKVKKSTIRKYIVDGYLKASTAGKNFIVREQDVNDFLDNSRYCDNQDT